METFNSIQEYSQNTENLPFVIDDRYTEVSQDRYVKMLGDNLSVIVQRHDIDIDPGDVDIGYTREQMLALPPDVFRLIYDGSPFVTGIKQDYTGELNRMRSTENFSLVAGNGALIDYDSSKDIAEQMIKYAYLLRDLDLEYDDGRLKRIGYAAGYINIIFNYDSEGRITSQTIDVTDMLGLKYEQQCTVTEKKVMQPSNISGITKLTPNDNGIAVTEKSGNSRLHTGHNENPRLGNYEAPPEIDPWANATTITSEELFALIQNNGADINIKEVFDT